MKNSDKKLCDSCHLEKPSYSKSLCFTCTAIELISENIKIWVERNEKNVFRLTGSALWF